MLLTVAAGPLAGMAGVGRGSGWRMYHHSFDRTLSYDDTLDDWLASAATMALRDRVQLLPPVPDRHGLLWSKKPIVSSDFEVLFTMSATDNGANRNEVQDGAVAFWLSPDDFPASFDEAAIVSEPSKDWSRGLFSAGFSLLGNRPNFKGLALTLLFQEGRQIVSGVWSDGSRAAAGVPELASWAQAEHRRSLTWMTAGTQVKIAVTKDGSVTGSVMSLDVYKHLAGARWGWAEDGVNTKFMLSFQAGGQVRLDDRGEEIGTWEIRPGNKVLLKLRGVSHLLRFEGSHRAVSVEQTGPALLYGGVDTGPEAMDWQVILRLPVGTVKSGIPLYLGFSGYTGAKAYVEVDLHRLETKNFDTNTVGEDDNDVLKETLDGWLKVLEQEKRLVSQASQGEAVRRLSQLLQEHIDRFDKAGLEVQRSLAGVESKLDALTSEMGTYLAAARSFSFDSGGFDPTEIRGHIATIRETMARSTHLHDTSVRAVQDIAKQMQVGGKSRSTEALEKLDSALLQAHQLEQSASVGFSQTTWAFVAIFGSVAGLGYLFLTKMWYYEKKHFV